MRKIIHIDMDAFFASVEQLDDPELRGRPVVVGGRPDARGVVAACSYEARAFGIKSAMPSAQAAARCPDAAFITPRMHRYRQVSEQIMAVFRHYTDLVEPLSLDEAYLDVTENRLQQSSATRLAQQICRRIHDETGLTASAGVSFNKFLAKIASDLRKPNGISVIDPEAAASFLKTLPIGSFHGVGSATERKMHALGIRRGADLLHWSLPRLLEHFGKHGLFFYQIVRGIDEREVQPHRVRKSIGAETTLRTDTRDRQQIAAIIERLVQRVADSLQNKDLVGRTITLKVRYHDFTTITRSTTIHHGANDAAGIMREIDPLLQRTEVGSRAVRLLGISLAHLAPITSRGPKQLLLPFTPAESPSPAGDNDAPPAGSVSVAPR